MTDMTDAQVGFSILLAIVVGLVILYVIMRLTLYAMAYLNLLVTFRSEGRFKLLMKGDVPVKVIYRLQGYKLRGGGGGIEAYDVIPFPNQVGGDEEMSGFEKLIEGLFGVYPVGLPPFRIFRYNFVYDREPRAGDPTNQPGYELEKFDKDHEVLHRSSESNYLAWKTVYPLTALSVETEDQTEINIYGTMTVEVMNVYRPLLVLRGSWFGHVHDAGTGKIGDVVKGHNISGWRKTVIKGGNNTNLEKAITATKDGDTGTIATTGMAIVAYNLADWAITGTAQEVEKAARAKELEKLNGQGRVAKARADATAIRVVGKATADAAKALAEAVEENPEATAILISQNQRDAFVGGLEKSRATTLVIGQGDKTLLPLGTPPSTPRTATTPTPATTTPTTPP